MITNCQQYHEYVYLATTRCNCKCKHCNPKLHTGSCDEMTVDDMIRQYEGSDILKQAPVYVSGGEPMIKEDIIKLIKYLDHHKISTVVTTNGWFTRKTEQLLEELEDNSSIRFAVSIDGPESMHDKIRGLTGVYKKALETATLIHDRGFRVQINMVIQKDNVDFLEEFDSLMRQKGIEVIYIPQVFVNDEPFSFTTKEIRHILKYANYPRARKYLLSKGVWRIRDCHAGKSSWLIDCSGDVYACWGGYYRDNAQDYLIGNLKEARFDSIFESERKKDVYRSVVKRCDGCLLPCDAERETEYFGLSTKLSFDEVAVLADDLSASSILNDFSVTETEWYGFESYEGHRFRWMRSTHADLFLNQTDSGSCTLRMDYINHCPEEKLSVTVSICDGKRKVVLPSVTPGLGLQNDTWTIPEEICSTGLITVSIDLNDTWRPSEYDPTSTDTRDLGLGVIKIEIE